MMGQRWGSGTLFNNLIGLFLRELVRYIHLNPVRVGMLEGLDGLKRNKFCGHSALMGKGLVHRKKGQLFT